MQTHDPDNLLRPLRGIRALHAAIPEGFPLPAGHALRAFARAVPGATPEALATALQPLSALRPSRIRRQRGQIPGTASDAASRVLNGPFSGLPAEILEHVASIPSLIPRGLAIPLPASLDDVLHAAPAHSPLHAAVAAIDLSPLTPTRARHAESHITDFLFLSAEARMSAPVNPDALPAGFLEHAHARLLPGAPNPPDLPDPTRGTLLAAAWTAPLTTDRGRSPEHLDNILGGIAAHAEAASRRGGQLVIPVLHGYIPPPAATTGERAGEDPANRDNTRSRHAATALPEILELLHRKYPHLSHETRTPDLDPHGQAMLNGHDPDWQPGRPAIVLVMPHNPTPAADMRTFLAWTADASHVFPADPLALSAALSACSRMTVLRSDLQLGDPYHGTIRRYSPRHPYQYSRPQVDDSILATATCGFAALADDFRLHITTASRLAASALDDTPALSPSGFATARITPPEHAASAATAAGPAANPDGPSALRIAIHGAFAQDAPSEALPEAAALAADALARLAVELKNAGPVNGAPRSLPARIRIHRSPGSDPGIPAALHRALHNRKRPPANCELANLAENALHEAHVHVVLGNPAHLPCRVRDAIAAACQPHREQGPAAVLFQDPPRAAMLLYGDPATRPIQASALPRPSVAPAWDCALCTEEAAPLIRSTRTHGALRIRQRQPLRDADRLASALLDATCRTCATTPPNGIRIRICCVRIRETRASGGCRKSGG